VWPHWRACSPPALRPRAVPARAAVAKATLCVVMIWPASQVAASRQMLAPAMPLRTDRATPRPTAPRTDRATARPTVRGQTAPFRARPVSAQTPARPESAASRAIASPTPAPPQIRPSVPTASAWRAAWTSWTPARASPAQTAPPVLTACASPAAFHRHRVPALPAATGNSATPPADVAWPSTTAAASARRAKPVT